jgi:hypothetical protein
MIGLQITLFLCLFVFRSFLFLLVLILKFAFGLLS